MKIRQYQVRCAVLVAIRTSLDHLSKKNKVKITKAKGMKKLGKVSLQKYWKGDKMKM